MFSLSWAANLHPKGYLNKGAFERRGSAAPRDLYSFLPCVPHVRHVFVVNTQLHSVPCSPLTTKSDLDI